MPYKEKIIEKVYFTIGDVAEKFDVATSLLRFWESEFKQLHPRKNRKGNREFTKKDIQVVQEIYSLVKDWGFTLSGAREIMDKHSSAKICHCCMGRGYVVG